MKKGKLLFSLLMVCLMIVMINSVLGLTATIDDPKKTIYKNITIGGDLIFEESVTVDNDNNYSILIRLSAGSSWKDAVEIENSEFILNPEERKVVPYTVTIKEPGIYFGEILIDFVKEDTNTVLSLVQEITVSVNKREKENMPKLIIYLLTLLILVILFLIIYKVAKK